MDQPRHPPNVWTVAIITSVSTVAVCIAAFCGELYVLDGITTAKKAQRPLAVGDVVQLGAKGKMVLVAHDAESFKAMKNAEITGDKTVLPRLIENWYVLEIPGGTRARLIEDHRYLPRVVLLEGQHTRAEVIVSPELISR